MLTSGNVLLLLSYHSGKLSVYLATFLDALTLYIGWGYALHNMGSYEEAIHKYQKVAELSPDHTDIYFYWGNILLVLGRYEEASKKYQKVTKLNPSYTDAFFNWGEALYNLNRFEEAINKYKKVINIDSGYTNAYFDWGNALFALKRYEKAIKKYRNVLDYNPDHIYVYFNWGQALYNLEKYEEAILKYRRVSELAPEYADTYLNWGNALYNSARKEEAIHKYKKAIELNPDCANAYLHWGEILYKLKIYDSAAEKFDKFTQLNPNCADTYFKWGNSLQKLHKYVEAAEKYQKARDLDSKYKTFTYSPNLQGIFFKGQNLTNIDFSYADIRGADFSNANLTSVNFNYAQTGLQEHWVLFWLIIPLLVFLLLAQVYLGLLFNSMSILDTALINTSSFKAIHALISTPVPNFLLIIIWQLFFNEINNLDIENAIQNYAPSVINIIRYLTIVPVLVVIATFFLITIFKGVNFALRRDVLLFIILIGFALTVSLSGALFGNVKITIFTTNIELLFSILAIVVVIMLTSLGIITVAIHGFVNPNIPVLRHRVPIVFMSLLVSIFHAIFDGIWSLVVLLFRIIILLIAIVNFTIPSKEFLSDKFRYHLKSIIISIIWVYSISILIYLYFSAINILGFVFITITVIQTLLVGYIVFCTLEGDEKFSLLKKFTIDVIAARGTSYRNANLENASFYQADLKNTDFKGAILMNTYLNDAKNLSLARINKKDLNR